MTNYIFAAVALVIAIAGYILRRRADAMFRADPSKKNKKRRFFMTSLVVIGLYFFMTRLGTIIFGAHEPLDMSEFSPWAERIDFFGFDLSVTVMWTWVVMAAIVAIAIVLRLTVVRKMKTEPTGAQNVLETIVDTSSKYAGANVHGAGDMLGSYIFSIFALLVACDVLELFRIRTPASDVTFTLALGLVTFVIINIYGIARKGIVGRIKSLANPTPVVLPIKIVTDLAIPVSLAARLFGNMLGGMIIMDLIYSALGNNALAIPSVAGLYFNVFHPLLQAFIFVTLSLTFINEAVE